MIIAGPIVIMACATFPSGPSRRRRSIAPNVLTQKSMAAAGSRHTSLGMTAEAPLGMGLTLASMGCSEGLESTIGLLRGLTDRAQAAGAVPGGARRRSGWQPTLASRFLRTLRPLPETGRDLGRQTIPQLARKHDDLAPMMAFVRNEIRKDVSNIERKIAPGIRRAGRDGAAVITPQRQEADHPPAAPVERVYELLRADATPIDRFRHFDPVLLAQRFDPHAARVVDVASDHPNCPARGTGHDGRPELCGQMLDQEDGDSIGRSPHWNDTICQIESRQDHRASTE